jgi:hypothetical protein
MLKLKGAEKLGPMMCAKWSYKIRSRSLSKDRRYKVEFLCPVCDGRTYEYFEQSKHELSGVFWSITWRSECRHLSGYVTFRADLGEIPVQKNGANIAVILPFYRPLGRGGPLWQRIDWGSSGLAARFGTVWHALKASSSECELLSVIQSRPN